MIFALVVCSKDKDRAPESSEPRRVDTGKKMPLLYIGSVHKFDEDEQS